MRSNIPIIIKTVAFVVSILFFSANISFAQSDVELKQAVDLANQGTEEGYKNAIVLYKKYETKLNASQFNDFGYCYWSLKDYKIALHYFELSASIGFEMGIFNSAYNYFYGNGTDKDFVKAYNYLSKLGQNFSEISEANHLMGHCIEYDAKVQGINGKPNYGLAYSYFLKAAEKGHMEGIKHVADYNNNSGKILTNYEKAKYWSKKACDANLQEYCEALAKINLLLAKNSENTSQNTANAKPKSTDYLSVLEAIRKNL